MKFKHTVDLIYFLRDVYDLQERNIYSPRIMDFLDIGNGLPHKIDDEVDGDSRADVYGNLYYRGKSKYLQYDQAIDGRFPLDDDEKNGFYDILNSILSAVKNDIDDKELCDSMIEYVKSTKFYIEKYGNDL